MDDETNEKNVLFMSSSSSMSSCSSSSSKSSDLASCNHMSVDEASLLNNHNGKITNGSLNGANNLNSFNKQAPTEEWIMNICSQVINDLNEFGLCVIDNFLGIMKCEHILNEVIALYKFGIFKDGQLVNDRGNNSTFRQTIRGDKIVWTEGIEKHCENINTLIQTLDTIIVYINSLNTFGPISLHKINSRTKAMIACYPGNSTHYVKHVDNPNQDGRCITSIYYLNKNWNVEKDGGLLRLFPQGKNKVADIAPYFDRVVFFWSDRRNPHEVQPAYSIRFAITVWYFDEEERRQAVQRNLTQSHLDKKLRPFNIGFINNKLNNVNHNH